jgi:hypothetical protein
MFEESWTLRSTTLAAALAAAALVAIACEPAPEDDLLVSAPPEQEIAAELRSCGGARVDLRTDPNNCGHCGRVCGPGSACYRGECHPAECGAAGEQCCVVAGSSTSTSSKRGRSDPPPVERSCDAGFACEGGRCVSTCASSPETCNGIDDDCDSQVDEGCPPACTPAPELCNGVDDDCDGVVDQNFAQGPCTVGVGACAQTGAFVCDASGNSAYCSVPNAFPPEQCGNAVDDDCDGQVDEGCTPGCVPVPERCNAVDDDCDGQVDENFAQGPCTAGVGACERSGTQVCDASGSGSFCNASPGLPVAEVCGNAVDDDCDGQTDEGC